LNKDGRTVRIAFVGASTTIGGYYLPFSYPEFIGQWLNQWLEAHGSSYRAEVMNAARTGIDSDSIAAIVRQELLPLEPDLVVFYEGAKTFAIGRTMKLPQRWKRERPRFTFRPPTRLEQVSALARRVTSFSVRLAATDGREPAKGVYPIVWPPSVDEDHRIRTRRRSRCSWNTSSGIWIRFEPRSHRSTLSSGSHHSSG
jgi:hypothetical protein